MSSIGFELKLSVGKLGEEESDFKRPMGIAIDSQNENIYIVDEGNRRVFIYSQEGEYLFSFPNTPQLLQGARGICIKSDRVYVSEEFLSVISIFTLLGEFITRFNGGNILNKNGFNVPTGLMLDDEENIYVCDCFNERIAIFTNELVPQFHALNLTLVKTLDIKLFHKSLLVLDGEGIKMIHTVTGKTKVIINNTTSYSEEGQVKYPIFFDIDQSGNIYISDKGNNCIKIFSKRGKLLSVIGRGGDMFKSPTGIAIVSRSGMIVSVCRNKERPLHFLKQIPNT